MRYAVTGAAGFVGSHLGETLGDLGHEVVGVDAYTDFYGEELKASNAARLDVVRLDLAVDRLEPAFDGVDGVFHLAGQPGVRDSWGHDFRRYLDRNLLATQRVFEWAAAAGVRVVFASSSSIYGDAERHPTPEDVEPRPISPYGITKLACEHLARAYAKGSGLDAIGLRYFTVYGPRQRPDMAFTRLLGALADGRPFPVYGDGSQSRDFTFVFDAVSATVGAMERGRTGSVYNVGGGSEATLRDVIDLAERISGRELEIEPHGPVAGDVRRTSADTTALRRDAGWAPRTTLEEGLRAQWQWITSTRPPAPPSGSRS